MSSKPSARWMSGVCCGILLATATLSSMGCTYMRHRGNDLIDVVTLSGETGYANVGLQVSMFLIGAGYSKGSGFGLRSGARGSYDYWEYNTMIFGGGKAMDPHRRKSKSYWYDYGPPACRGGARGLRFHAHGDEGSTSDDSTKPASTSKPANANDPYAGEPSNDLTRWPFLLQLEANACLIVGLRVGINFGEALDFVLGWTTLDICGDDEWPEEPEKKTRTPIKESW